MLAACDRARRGRFTILEVGQIRRRSAGGILCKVGRWRGVCFHLERYGMGSRWFRLPSMGAGLRGNEGSWCVGFEKVPGISRNGVFPVRREWLSFSHAFSRYDVLTKGPS